VPAGGDLLVRGRWVVFDPALLPDGGVVPLGALVVRDGRVHEVGEYAELRPRYEALPELGSDRHVVIPGLVNSHHHGWGLSPLQVGCRDDYLERFLIDLLGVTPPDPYLETLYSAMNLVRSGVTTVLHSAFLRDWGWFEDEIRAGLTAYAASGVRVAYAVPVADRNTFVYQDDEQFLGTLPDETRRRVAAALEEASPPGGDEWRRVFRALREEHAEDPRVEILLGPVGPEWCSDGLLAEVRDEAARSGAGIHFHFLESPYQREFLRRAYGTAPARHLDELGLLGEHVSVAHGVWLTEEEIQLCAERGVSVCHNASSNLRLRVGILPLPALLEKGINVAIGMDSTTINDDDDMLQEMRLVDLLHRLPRGLGDAPCPLPFDVMKMATVNGARATGFGPEIGGLSPGQLADLVLLDWTEVEKPYVHETSHVIETLVTRARKQCVDTVVIGGEVVLRGGEFVHLDADRVARELGALAARAPQPRSRRWTEALEDVRPYVEAYYRGWASPPYEPYYTVNSRT
jgi:5-methylthioadenosine/S-adenosylhomocysteine deaminase